ncbi:hypothetical protein C8R45DRAFT_922054 [Mycena sanguinolenta]|nr:hypothetical protein C8R45DRAFT_922054 [Mycena sanguinolenta]
MATPLPNAGIVAPIPDSFDFVAWMNPPPAKDPTGRTLRIRNRHNLSAELANEVSIDQTLNCRDDRSKYPDVGAVLVFFYGYTQDDMTDMINSKTLCADVGPIPAFIRVEVERARRKRSDRVEAEKSEKTKGRPLKGSMVLSNPIVRVPGQRETVVVPLVVQQSVLQKLYVPLSWFTDRRLQMLEHQLDELPTLKFWPQPTLEIPNPDKVLVLDVKKMKADPDWGSDELASCLSPLKWQQAAANLEATLAILSENVPDVSGTVSKPTFFSEFKKHRRFFMNYDKFEENYTEWYPFEREARHAVLRGFLFDSDYYTRQVDGMLHAKKAVVAYASDSLTRKYQPNDRETEQHSSKLQKHGNGGFSSSSASSSRSDSSARGDNHSFRNGNRDSTRSVPTCIACEGNHRLQNHPPKATSFPDGSSCFSAMRDGELWTSKPYQGPNTRRVCIAFNLPQGCHRAHEVPALHICSLCGKDHGAVPRNTACARSGTT